MATILASLGWAGNSIIHNLIKTESTSGVIERGREARDKTEAEMSHRMDLMELRIQSLEEHLRRK